MDRLAMYVKCSRWVFAHEIWQLKVTGKQWVSRTISAEHYGRIVFFTPVNEIYSINLVLQCGSLIRNGSS